MFFLQAEYQKDAEKMMHQHNLPLDCPEFVQAKINAKNASDVSPKSKCNSIGIKIP